MKLEKNNNIFHFFTKSFIFIFLFTFLIQVFLFNNAISKNSLSDITSCSLVEEINLSSLEAESLLISSVDIPIIPEFENLKCLNTIHATSITQDFVYVSLAQNKILYTYALVTLVIINFFFYLFRKEKLSLLFFFLATLNLYIFLVAINSIFEMFVLACYFSLPLLIDTKIEQININIILFGVLLFSFFLQQFYLSKEIISWDTSGYLVMGQDINRGNLPWENQLEVKGVLLFYIYSIIDFFSSGDYRIVKLLNDVPYLLLVIIMFGTLKQKGKQSNIIAALLIYATILSIEYYGATGLSEPYALIPIALAIYLLEKKQNTNFLFLGILFSLATLTNHGTVIFFIAATFYLYSKHRKQLFNFFIGFSLPHLFFLFIYIVNDLLRVYLIANIKIPLGYTTESFQERVFVFLNGFKGEISGIYSYNIFLAGVVLFIAGFIGSLALRSLKNNSLPNALSSLPYFFVGGLVHMFFIGANPGRYNFLIYLFCLYIINIQENFSRIFLLPFVVMVSLSVLMDKYEKSFENIQNFETIEENYDLQKVSEELKIKYGVDANANVLALDNNLILWYLNVPNFSYVTPPPLIFLNEVNLFDNPENTTKKEIFDELISKEPDIIICNDGLYEFCKEIDGYKIIFERWDIFINED